MTTKTKKTNRPITKPVIEITEKIDTLQSICSNIQALQRSRAWYLKTRIMAENRLTHTIAGYLGYHTGLEEKHRAELFKQAREIIITIDDLPDHPMQPYIGTIMPTINNCNFMISTIEKQMIELVEQLPVYHWTIRSEQRGFGLKSLAVIVGESGDISNYPNPAKLWRRFGCAPFNHNGKNQMGSTWRSGQNGKLPAEIWEEFGYSPRRRSIAFVVGECLIRKNFYDGERDRPGPYVTRYNEAKQIYLSKHPDSTKMHAHKHGMLLATKLLLKNLWIEWHEQCESPSRF